MDSAPVGLQPGPVAKSAPCIGTPVQPVARHHGTGAAPGAGTELRGRGGGNKLPCTQQWLFPAQDAAFPRELPGGGGPFTCVDPLPSGQGGDGTGTALHQLVGKQTDPALASIAVSGGRDGVDTTAAAAAAAAAATAAAATAAAACLNQKARSLTTIHLHQARRWIREFSQVACLCVVLQRF
jgi:hypothetical protein